MIPGVGLEIVDADPHPMVPIDLKEADDLLVNLACTTVCELTYPRFESLQK